MKVKLLVVHGRPQGKSLQFPHGEFVIGRGHECHVRPNSDWVSRQHCLLRVTDQTVHLRDLGSTNGTLVNGRRVVADQLLRHGDQLQVGPLVFEVQLEEPLPSELERGDIHTLDPAHEVRLDTMVLGRNDSDTARH